MIEKDEIFKKLCIEIMEAVTKNLLQFTESESETLKILKIIIEKSIFFHRGENND